MLFQATTTTTIPSTSLQYSEMTVGLNNIPTETKNKTEKASCIGNASAAARWLSSDSPITAPAKNAPSANEIPNTCAAMVPTPSAIVNTDSVNNSREPVRATCSSSQGTKRRPTKTMSVTKETTLTLS